MKNGTRKPWAFQNRFLEKNLETLITSLSNKEFKRVESRENLMREISPGECWIIVKGEVVFSSVSSSGERFEISSIYRGGLIGLLPFVFRNHEYELTVSYPLEAYVAEESEVKKVLSQMKASISFKPSIFGKNIYIPLSPMIGMDIQEKVLYILDYLAALEEKRTGRRMLKISTSKIADLTGMKRGVVTLAFGKLVKLGWISVIQGNIMVKRR